jgi:ABC-2 type transport system permease protein
MRNVWIIARREYKLFFISPTAYVVAFFFMILLGWFFYSALRDAIIQAAYQPYAPGVQIIISPLVTLLLFVMPAITMKSIAEEMRMGTMELLLTAPVKDWELVVGKWLGAFLFMLSLLVVTWIFPIVLNFLVKPGIDQGIFLADISADSNGCQLGSDRCVYLVAF